MNFLVDSVNIYAEIENIKNRITKPFNKMRVLSYDPAVENMGVFSVLYDNEKNETIEFFDIFSSSDQETFRDIVTFVNSKTIKANPVDYTIVAVEYQPKINTATCLMLEWLRMHYSCNELYDCGKTSNEKALGVFSGYISEKPTLSNLPKLSLLTINPKFKNELPIFKGISNTKYRSMKRASAENIKKVLTKHETLPLNYEKFDDIGDAYLYCVICSNFIFSD